MDEILNLIESVSEGFPTYYTIIDISSDSQVNSDFPYRWSPASLTFSIFFYFFIVIYNESYGDNIFLDCTQSQNEDIELIFCEEVTTAGKVPKKEKCDRVDNISAEIVQTGG